MVSDTGVMLMSCYSKGLNPCCNGIWSQTFDDSDFTEVAVLILVVMEYGLRLIG